jgi:uncharacterized repeat protein (TIGR04052 family)
MSKKENIPKSLLSAITLAALSGCGGGGSSAEDNSPRAITLDFAAYAGSTPVRCGTVVSGLGSGNTEAQIKDFRFYVSNVKLVKADGTKVALTLGANDDWNLTVDDNRLTLIDLEDGTGSCSAGTTATNAQIKGTVPAGSYVGIEMTMGVPFALNHSDYATATKPLDVQAMAWSWQVGRKHAKIEVTDPAGTAGSWTAKTFNVHLGSTGCTGNPASGETVSCVAPNRMDFSLASFNPATQKIAVDLQALLAGNDITRNQAGATGCMSGGTDPECQKVFEALAIDWKADGTGTGLPINGGAAQTLMKVLSQ